jgi:signal transduction histidine kinase
MQIKKYCFGSSESLRRSKGRFKKKFYKGSSKARGTGIGLAVCDEIVLMHGGELSLENADGGGTLVTVRIPASQ